MKILFYLHRYPAIGGIERVTMLLANAFAQRGEKVCVVSHFGVEGQTFGSLASSVDFFQTPKSKYYSAANRKWLQSKIEAFQPDVIIFQDSYAPIARNLFPLRLKIPVIVCEHNAPNSYYPPPVKSSHKALDLLRTILYPVIREIKFLRDRVRRKYLYDKAWRYCLLSERFFGEFKAVAKIEDARKLIAIPNSSPSKEVNTDGKCNEIVFVGAMNERKGCEVLLDVWTRICKRHGDWRLTFVGDGPLRAKLEKKVSEGKIERVAFEGYQRDAVKYFRRSKIFAFPSRQEGWGLVLTEAMAASCVPIVFNSFSSLGDIVEHNVNGIVIPAFDEEKFETGLEELMNSPTLLARLAVKGMQVCEKYSPQKIIDMWYEVFGKLKIQYNREDPSREIVSVMQ